MNTTRNAPSTVPAEFDVRRVLVHMTIDDEGNEREHYAQSVDEVQQLIRELSAKAESARRELLNTPELRNFSEGVTLEALHQRGRWGADHDSGKTPADWFWLIGFLAGKALHAQTSGNTEKALHHTISTAAALANWHAAISGEHTAMRPGIVPAAHGLAA